MRAGPRINTDDVAPLCALFLTCREENMYSGTKAMLSPKAVKMQMQNSLTWDGGHYCMMENSLQSGPMLDINCPISHKPWAAPLPQAHPPFPPYKPTHVPQFFTVKTTSACRKPPRWAHS
jgi:hypothetical protein